MFIEFKKNGGKTRESFYIPNIVSIRGDTINNTTIIYTADRANTCVDESYESVMEQLKYMTTGSFIMNASKPIHTVKD
jgi:hypothetical protein